MKLRFPFSRQQLFSLAGAIALLSASVESTDAQAPAQAPGQATIRLTTGVVQQGTILGMQPTGVELQFTGGKATLPLARIAEIRMDPPPAYRQAYDAFAAKDYPKALNLLRTVTDRFKGLPTDWARYATGLLGDIYVAMNDLPKAEAAYTDFKRLYPGPGSLQSDVGLARIAAAKKDYPAAKRAIEPIVTKALEEKNVTAANGAAFGQAFLVSGTIKESEGNLSGALEDYLRTVTLFYHDRAAVALAQERADALRAKNQEKPIIVP